MPVSKEEYEKAKKVNRVSLWLIMIMLFILPSLVAYILIKTGNFGWMLLVGAVCTVGTGLIGAFDTIEESGQTIKNYENGF